LSSCGVRARRGTCGGRRRTKYEHLRTLRFVRASECVAPNRRDNIWYSRYFRRDVENVHSPVVAMSYANNGVYEMLHSR
jgi:hypothetical protein